MVSELKGYFEAPYGEQELSRLAKSSEALDRWEAANALVGLDEKIARQIFQLLEKDPDSLVQKALANQRERFGSKSREPKTGKSGGPKGAFREAWGQPLGPSKVNRLCNMAKAAAIESVHAQSGPRISMTFPQANSVETLMEMLDQVIDTNAIHGPKLGLVDRQVLYYRDALRWLNLLELTSRGVITVNPKLFQLSSPYQRLEFTIRSLLEGQSTSAAYLGLMGENSAGDFAIPTNAKKYLEYFATSPDSRGLSGSTLTRRAQTAFAWATQIMNILGIDVREPAAWKAAVPKFMRLNHGHAESP